MRQRRGLQPPPAQNGRATLPLRGDGAGTGSDPLRPTTPGVRGGLVGIAAVIFLLGLSLFVFPGHTDRLFAWTIQPPLTAAFLGASYWAATTLALACAAEREWVCARAFAPPYLIAGVVLLVVTLVHIDKFHMDEVTGWAWLTLYAIFPPAMVALLLQQIRVPGEEPPRLAPIPSAALGVLALQASVMVLLGTALVLVPLDAAALWPWPVTALTGRAIGVFVLAQGALIFTVCREHDWGRVRPAMLQYALLGVLHLVALLRFSDTVEWDRPAAFLYPVFVGSVLVMGLYGVARVVGAVRDGTAPSPPRVVRRALG
jgi:hypothetical protein